MSFQNVKFLLSALIVNGLLTIGSLEATWTSPSTISDTYNAFTSLQKANAAGDAIAVWTVFDGSNLLLQGATFSGGVWSSTTIISSSGADVQSPMLAIDAAGDGVVIWTAGASNTAVYASTIPNGGSWSSPVILSDINLSGFEPQVNFYGSSGDAVATWTEYDGTSYFIQSATFSP